MDRPLEAQPFLASQDAIDPAFLIGAGGIKCGEGLSQFPKAGITSGTLFDDEAFQCLGAP